MAYSKISTKKLELKTGNDELIGGFTDGLEIGFPFHGKELFFLLLHVLQAGTTFPLVVFPPLATGTM